MPTCSWIPRGALLFVALGALGTACTEQEPEPAQDQDQDEPELAQSALTTPGTYQAQVKQRTLTITGDGRSSRLALRLQSPTTLAVDVNDDGSAEFLFDRSTFESIRIDGGGGDDV